MADERTGVAGWRLGLVALTTLASVAASVWLIQRSDLVVLYALWSLFSPLPLVFARDGAAFRTACLIAGGVLVGTGLFYALLGLVLFVPSGVALLAVGLADRPSGPVWGTVSMVVSVVSLTCWTVGIIERV